jgi:hypothetical protein
MPERRVKVYTWAVVSFVGITALAIVVAVVIAAYLSHRFRGRCPYRSPLCRPSRPCLQCYRDLYKNSAAKRGTG